MAPHPATTTPGLSRKRARAAKHDASVAAIHDIASSVRADIASSADRARAEAARDLGAEQAAAAALLLKTAAGLEGHPLHALLRRFYEDRDKVVHRPAVALGRAWGPLLADAGTAASVAQLVDTAALRDLSLAGSRVALTGGPLAFCLSFPNLTALDVSSCAVPQASLVALGKRCARGTLASLSVRDCAGIDDAALRGLSRARHALRRLDVAGSAGVTAAGLDVFLRSLAKPLLGLGLARCGEVDELALENIAKRHASALASVALPPRATDASVGAILAACRSSLTALDVSDCPLVTDDALRCTFDVPTIYERDAANAAQLRLEPDRRRRPPLAGLTALSCRGCPLVTGLALSFVAAGCPNLARLDCSLCRGVADDGLSLL